MPLPPLIRALLDSDAYPGGAREVTLRQTHISYLFFTPSHVYKVKKPVDFGFLDFSTLDKRLHYCHEEVRLNRRLAPDIYLGVVPITSGARGVKMGDATDAPPAPPSDDDEPIEYAVKMKRLDPDTILEEMLNKGVVGPEVLEGVAEVIAAFHKKAHTSGRIASFGLPAMIKQNTDENFAQTKNHIGGTITRARFEVIKNYTNGFLESKKELLTKRVQGGFIRDCHGDIHSEHVSISDRIRIFDCIEFNERFRYSDTAADAAFLSMDLDFRNRHDLASAFERAYFSSSADPDAVELFDFYKCYRAFVRGKVEDFRLMEPEETDQDKLEADLNARLYFHLAYLYATGGYRPTAVVIRGLSGTGKSVLAHELSKLTRYTVVSSDPVRKELFDLAPDEHSYAPFEKGIYSQEATEKTYEELVTKGAEEVASGRSVILDATFTELKYLHHARDTLASLGADFQVVECTADEVTVRERFKERKTDTEDASDARWGIYQRQKELFEGLSEAGVAGVEIRCEGEPEGLAREVLEKLLSY